MDLNNLIIVQLNVQRELFLTILELCKILLESLRETMSTTPSRRDPQKYHTSILSGHAWVLELITGNPDRIQRELGLSKEDFKALVAEFRDLGHEDSRRVTLEEQIAIFLYMCVTGLTLRRVGERFQRSSDTISRYFKLTLDVLSSPPFYTKYIVPPSGDTVASKIRQNPRFFPYFRHAIGAVDASHIPASSPSHKRSVYRNRKGFLSQNALFVSDFDFRFTHTLTGWEGSVTDARVIDDALTSDLHIPRGKYLLADGGYPLRPELLVPYRGVRYHLAERGRASMRPSNREELFNLRHASACNVVKRISGILKRRYRILLLPTEFPLDMQAQIPAALCALHNFISVHKSGSQANGSDLYHSDLQSSDDSGDAPQNLTAKELRDGIAQAMWDDYQQILADRMMDDSEDEVDWDSDAGIIDP